MAGMVLDASTIGLWRLRERERATRKIVDAVGGRHLQIDVGNAAANIAISAPARNKIGTCRKFQAQQYGGGIGPGDPTMQASLLGSCTVELWLRHDHTTALAFVLFQYGAGGSDSSSDSNFLGQLCLNGNNSNRLRWHHEHGSGTNVHYDQATGSGLTINTWYHVAAVKTVTGSNCTIKFYVNGALVDTSGTLTSCTGGSASWISVGATCGLGDASFLGDIKDIRISSLARSTTEILASASKVDQKHDIDGSTVSLYRLEEAADGVDASPSAMHLFVPIHDIVNTSDDDPIELGDGDTCGGRFFNGETELDAYAAHPSASIYRAALEADCTFEAWLKPDGTLVQSSLIPGMGIFSYGAETGSTSTTTNAIALRVSSAGNLIAVAYHGAGIAATYTTTATPFTGSSLRTIHHLAVTKRLVGGGNFRWEFYVDGTFLEESGDLLNYESSASATIYWRLGFSNAAGFYKHYKGLMYEARLSNVRRSAAEILESYTRGVPCLNIGTVEDDVETVTVVTGPIPDPLVEGEEEDIYFDVSAATGPDYYVTPAGDWLPVTGDEALRQSLLRRFITNPGEWQTKPGYGAGGRAFVKAKATKANRDAFSQRLREQALKDKRVASVSEVKVESFADGGYKYSVAIVPKGRDKRSKPVLVTVDTTQGD